MVSFGGLLLIVLSLVTVPPPAHAAGTTTPGLNQAPDVITARIGISPGDENQGLSLGSDRRVLERVLPELFETAMSLGVRIDTVSVGKGYFSGDDGVESETDLDLVVTGVRPNVLALAATLGQHWRQSLVFVWETRADGDQLTATILLPGGTAAITDATFETLIAELPDGGHIRYAGPDSLIFIANTGTASDDEFRARLTRAQRALDGAGLRTGTLSTARAAMVELNRDNYQQFIAGAIRGKAAMLPLTIGRAA